MELLPEEAYTSLLLWLMRSAWQTGTQIRGIKLTFASVFAFPGS